MFRPAGWGLRAPERGAQRQSHQNYTKLIAGFSRHPYAYLARRSPATEGPGRLMRLGWRYLQLIRTFRNHAAAAFPQCTGALSSSQGNPCRAAPASSQGRMAPTFISLSPQRLLPSQYRICHSVAFGANGTDVSNRALVSLASHHLHAVRREKAYSPNIRLGRRSALRIGRTGQLLCKPG